MITVVCSTQRDITEFKEHVIKTSGLRGKLQFLEYVNKGTNSLTEIYNKGLSEAENDIVVFLHNDITINTKQWGEKLLKLFSRNEHGIIGLAGSRSLPMSGIWWETRNDMVGQVYHRHEGRTWLSEYSKSLGDHVEDVVTVDGLFIAVDKHRIKRNFDESVGGFHFYDVSFCLSNHIEGVKIGVTTRISVTHDSIGLTNDAWENNRVGFVEKNKTNLPARAKRVLRKGEKLNVLIGCLSFAEYTGSELYVFELAKGLVRQGCDVTVVSRLGNPLAMAAKQNGINVCDISEPPNYKKGDGKWLVKTQNGEVPSQPNVLYKIANKKFDVLHLNHKPVTEHLMKLYPDTPVVCGVHSEVIALEEPVISDRVDKYIAIRPEIKNHLCDKYGIDKNKISVVYNPIDEERFKPKSNERKRDVKRILFVGTVDYLRKEAILDMVSHTRDEGSELVVVGRRDPKNDYMAKVLETNNHVTYHPPTKDIERFIHQCDETAGILLGRTTIEGFMCGKKGWIYNVDEHGYIQDKKLHDVPEDVEKFKLRNVVLMIKDIYQEVL